MEKCNQKNIQESNLKHIYDAGNIFLREGRDKIQIL